MEPDDLSLSELATAIRTRRLSAVEALQAHLDRIDAVNPAINAIVTLDVERALDRARAADAALAAGEAVRPLHGVPMTHKDNHQTAGMRTTWGSPVFRDFVPEQDSLIIDRLKLAGVNSTGKSNVPEFAAGSHTFNPVFGRTGNPYDPGRSAGGSSGGAAAAIAAGIQPAGDGSDMGGSLRTPASFCNLVALRPSHGRIPILPSKNPWAWISRQGFLARRTADVRLLMDLVAGPDARIPGSLPDDGAFTQRRLSSLRGLRVGWTSDFGLGVPVENEVLSALRPAAEQFEQLGAVVEEAVPDLSRADEVFQTTRAFDFATAYGQLMPEHGAGMKHDVRWNIRKGLDLTAEELISANAARGELAAATRAFFADYDLLLAPAVQVLPFDGELTYPTEVAGTPMHGYLDWMRAATLISATGLPALSVPAGFSAGGLPVGLQIIAGDRLDGLLLDVAELFEEATGHWRRRPQLSGRVPSGMTPPA